MFEIVRSVGFTFSPDRQQHKKGNFGLQFFWEEDLDIQGDFLVSQLGKNSIKFWVWYHRDKLDGLQSVFVLL